MIIKNASKYLNLISLMGYFESYRFRQVVVCRSQAGLCTFLARLFIQFLYLYINYICNNGKGRSRARDRIEKEIKKKERKKEIVIMIT